MELAMTLFTFTFGVWWCGGLVDSMFDACLKDIGYNPAEAGHCVTTVGKLFTLAVFSGAEGRLNQLTPGIAGASVANPGTAIIYLHWLRSPQPFILNWWIN